jgi:hypothetical protein
MTKFKSLSLRGYTLGAFGLEKDISKTFYKKRKEYIESLESLTAGPQKDSAPPRRDIILDLDLLEMFSDNCSGRAYSYF